MTLPLLEPVLIAPRSLDRFREVLDDAEFGEFDALARRAGEMLKGRAVWCVNSTARGGGVAEILQSLLSLTRGAGIDTRWSVLCGTPEFFAVTKRLHNRLHGFAGDGGPLGPAERAIYESVTEPAAAKLAELMEPGDIVILHDPQTAGLAPGLRRAGIHALVWRCHIGVDEPGDAAREARDFLRPYVDVCARAVFSRERFVWEGLKPDTTVVIPPSIDVFSAKNQTLGPEQVAAILAASGLVRGGDHEAATFLRADGTPWRVDHRAAIVEEQPLTADTRLVVQVSRWDALKDPLGVMRGFVAHAGECCDAHLVLAGPMVEGVADDPEGAAVLESVEAAWHALPPEARSRVHLASLPMADVEENAAIVNALQTRADVIVQKSLAEGFGLTAAEAMWKSRPLVVSGVGGLQDQVIEEVTGIEVDPHDLGAFGHAICRLLSDPALAARLGAAAHERVRREYLESVHLTRWMEVVTPLVAETPIDAHAEVSA